MERDRPEQYKLFSLEELEKDKELKKQFDSQLADYIRETGEMWAPRGSHLFALIKDGRIVRWTLGHPATFRKVFEGEKSFVPVAEYTSPAWRGKIPWKNYWISLVDKLKKEGFDFFHMRPDAPFMTTEKGERMIDLRHRILKGKRGLRENEGSVGDNILCLNFKRVQKKLEGERVQRELEERRAREKRGVFRRIRRRR